MGGSEGGREAGRQEETIGSAMKGTVTLISEGEGVHQVHSELEGFTCFVYTVRRGIHSVVSGN